MAMRIYYSKWQRFLLSLAKLLAPVGYHVVRHPDIVITQEVEGVPEGEQWFMHAYAQRVKPTAQPCIFDHRASLAVCIQHCAVMGYSYDIEFNCP